MPSLQTDQQAKPGSGRWPRKQPSKGFPRASDCMTYAVWLLSAEARAYEMPNQRHSSRALLAQHQAWLASPTEPASIRLQVLCWPSMSARVGEKDPCCSCPRHVMQGAQTPPGPCGTGSFQASPSPAGPSQVSWELHCWGTLLGRDFPQGAGEMGALSEHTAVAALAGLAPLALVAALLPAEPGCQHGAEVSSKYETGKEDAQKHGPLLPCAAPAGRCLLSLSPRSRKGRKASEAACAGLARGC